MSDIDEEIVILGNGFDISCGLNSSYSDFYNMRYHGKHKSKDIQPSDFSLIGATCEDICVEDYNWKTLNFENYDKTITFWDLAIYDAKKTSGTWQDFESFIKETLNIIYDSLKYVIDYLNVPSLSNWSLDSVIFLEKNQESAKRLFSFLYLRAKTDSDTFYAPLTYELISNFLLKELKTFEDEFCNYMLKEIQSPQTEYEFNSKDLLRKIQNKAYAVTSNIVTFNYTTPTHIHTNHYGGELIKKWVKHIHGDLDNHNIIFGINVSDISPMSFESENGSGYFNNPLLKKFTKTYRTLSLTNIIPLYTNDTSVIKFFGHSLGDADFSYFKVMFDSLNLYDGDLILKFYYSNYDTTIDVKANQISFVVHLLEEYEKGLKREKLPYTGYIFDKLRTQGRLSIIDVDSIL